VKWEEINDWLQVIGLVAVAVSLVFVGYELKLSRDIAIADIYQQRTELGFQLIKESSGNEEFVTAWHKLKRGEKLTDYEEALLDSDYLRWLTHWENLHFQYQMGLLTQEQWDASYYGLRLMVTEEQFQRHWNVFDQNMWRGSYKSLINSLIEEGRRDQSPDGT
jgi:hypothetical protein